jgi:hypothetical protein
MNPPLPVPPVSWLKLAVWLGAGLFGAACLFGLGFLLNWLI